ncbi:MAG: efflux RND transporter permease subunit [Polyangiaceae bacterium]
MKLADVSIRRPVFAVMLIAALLVFGVLAYPRMGVDLFPNVEFPVVTITVVYPGADPETMETKVADPIEEAVNTLGGIKVLRSVNLESVTQVVVQFELEVKVDQAMQDIRDKISGVTGQLPPGIDPPVVQKFDVGATPVMSIALSGNLGPRALTELADDVVKERIQRIAGVGGVDLIGGRERQIKILLDPARLAGLGLSVDDVAGAVRAQNMDLPAGSVEKGAREFSVKTKGEVKNAAELEQILIPNPRGTSVRVRDVGRVVDGVADAKSASFLDGKSAVSLVVRKQSGENTVAVAERVRHELEALRPRIEKTGAVLTVPTDNSVFIEHSIADVQFDLVFGGFLAVLIIWLFLRDFRATLISAVAIPTSVVASFAFMQWLGFTFNNMTMLALSLSIGILIDDAIVVIENIHRHLELGKSPMQAASSATAEIFLAVLATTSSILAVFVPVALMKGIIGRFFFQFGITVSVAVAVSMLVSFTLTPMLSSRFLGAGHGQRRNVIFRAIERVLDWADQTYGRIVRWALAHRLVTLGLATLALLSSFVLVSRVKAEFLPPEDRAQFELQVELPTGSSLSATSKVAEAIAADVRERATGVRNTFTTVSGGAQGQSNQASIQVVMTSASARKFHQEDLMAWARQRYGKVPDVKVTAQPINAVGGGGGFRQQPIQFNVRGKDMDELVRVTSALKSELSSVQGLVDLDTTYRGGKPELEIHVDRERAASLGVPVASVASTVRALIAQDAVSELKDGADAYDIVMQLPEEQRRDIDQLANLKVRAVSGQLVEMSNVVRLDRGLGPSQIERQARQRQITVLAGTQGLPLGEAKKAVDVAAKRVVPSHLTSDYAGMADIMGESFGYMGIALILAIVLVYMILAAQFDSFVQPITIMLSLPLSVVGAFGGLFVSGMTLNIFSMIGVIMLMGLVTKNAILLVDFANHLRAEGEELREALVRAGVIRLRPIVMTTAAMIFGMLPVALALSEGGAVRAPMAVCVIGGLLTSTALTLVVVPVVYTFMDGLGHSRPVRWLTRQLIPTPLPAGDAAARTSNESESH